MDGRAFEKLLRYLERVPAVRPISHGDNSGGWVKLVIVVVAAAAFAVALAR